MKARALTFLLLFAFIGSLSAADFSAAGFSSRGSVQIDGKNYERLADPAGGEILFAADSEPSPDALANLARTVTALRSWRGLGIAEIRAIAENGRIRVLVLPSSIKRDGKEYVGFVVGGIQIFISKGIEYDFRLKSGKYFVRLDGFLAGEDELLGDIARAAADPVAFLTERDPRYAIQRIAELEDKIDAALAAFNAAAAEQAAAAARSTEERKAQEEGLASRIAALETSMASLEARLAATEATLAEERRIRLEVIQPALLQALNKGKALPAPAVNKLIELKTADPGLTVDAAVLALKAQKLPLSKAQVGFVYLVIFGIR